MNRTPCRAPPPAVRRQRQRRRLLVLLALACVATSHAADEARALRDPMVPLFSTAAPKAAPAPGAPAPAASAARAEPAVRLPQHIVVIDGRHYLIDGGRRRGVGDAFGNARIERIEDAAVWVREGTSVRRLPMYGQAVRRAAAGEPVPVAPSPAAAPPALATDADAPRRGNRFLSRNTLPGDPS